MTFYGQFNPVFQSFDDGEETTSGIVDNGNWNSRVGFTLVQPSGDITLRARFETGLGFRNSALVSQEFTPEWIDWQRNRVALVRGRGRFALRHALPRPGQLGLRRNGGARRFLHLPCGCDRFLRRLRLLPLPR